MKSLCKIIEYMRFFIPYIGLDYAEDVSWTYRPAWILILIILWHLFCIIAFACLAVSICF